MSGALYIPGRFGSDGSYYTGWGVWIYPVVLIASYFAVRSLGDGFFGSAKARKKTLIDVVILLVAVIAIWWWTSIQAPPNQ